MRRIENVTNLSALTANHDKKEIDKHMREREKKRGKKRERERERER